MLFLAISIATLSAQVPFSGTLSGAQEVPAVTTAATGKVEGIFDPFSRVLAFRVDFSGLSANAVAAHFHRGAAGTNGPVVLDFEAQGFPLGAQSGSFVKVLTLTEAQAVDLMNSNLYVNIHTSTNRGGEIRAQMMYGALAAGRPIPVTATLSGAQEVPAVTTNGTGKLEGIFDPASRNLAFRVDFSGLNTGTLFAHFHRGAAGANGPVVVDFGPSFPTGVQAGTYIREVTLTPELSTALQAGLLYINIHTTSNRPGEIRGQVNYNPADIRPIPVTGMLSGAQEVPAVTTAATGAVTGSFDPVRNLMAIHIQYTGLSSNTVAAHIHSGAMGSNGPVVLDFMPLGFTFGATSGTFSKILSLNAAQAKDLLDGKLYVNIHTTNNRGGEIRAQLNAIRIQTVAPGVEERTVETALQAAIWPNPATEWVTISGEATGERLQAELFDLSGRMIDFTETDASVLEWQVGNLARGMYLVRVKQGTRSNVYKMIKE